MKKKYIYIYKPVLKIIKHIYFIKFYYFNLNYFLILFLLLLILLILL